MKKLNFIVLLCSSLFMLTMSIIGDAWEITQRETRKPRYYNHGEWAYSGNAQGAKYNPKYIDMTIEQAYQDCWDSGNFVTLDVQHRTSKDGKEISALYDRLQGRGPGIIGLKLVDIRQSQGMTYFVIQWCPLGWVDAYHKAQQENFKKHNERDADWSIRQIETNKPKWNNIEWGHFGKAHAMQDPKYRYATEESACEDCWNSANYVTLEIYHKLPENTTSEDISILYRRLGGIGSGMIGIRFQENPKLLEDKRTLRYLVQWCPREWLSAYTNAQNVKYTSHVEIDNDWLICQLDTNKPRWSNDKEWAYFGNAQGAKYNPKHINMTRAQAFYDCWLTGNYVTLDIYHKLPEGTTSESIDILYKRLGGSDSGITGLSPQGKPELMKDRRTLHYIVHWCPLGWVDAYHKAQQENFKKWEREHPVVPPAG